MGKQSAKRIQRKKRAAKKTDFKKTRGESDGPNKSGKRKKKVKTVKRGLSTSGTAKHGKTGGKTTQE